MSYPSKPDAAYDYTTWAAQHPTDPLPGVEVAGDFAEHRASISRVIDFQMLAQRSDGRLANGSVRPETLSPGVVALIGKWTPRGAWATATAYVVNDLVEESSQTFVCIVAHTSGVFATDRAAGNWQRIDGASGSLNGNNVWGGTQEFDGAVNFDAAVDFDGAVDMTGATVTVPTASPGDSDTSVASTAFVAAAVSTAVGAVRIRVQKFTSVPTTVTVTSATPAVMTWTSHGLSIGQAFQVATSGTLPAGMSLLTTYYIISAGFGVNSFQFSLTRGGAAVNTTNTGSGTHTATPYYVPFTGMVSAIEETWGGGAGGGGTANTASGVSVGGGGGAGGYSRKIIAAADVPAGGVPVIIGAAGAGGTAGNNAGGNGGNTSIGSLCVANGGTGGQGNAGNTVVLGGAGGTAGTGDIAAVGARGGAVSGISTAASVTVASGAGASSPVGSGGTAAVANGAGGAASGFAAGGGGGFSGSAGGAAAGGNGTPGFGMVTEICSA